MHASRAVLVKHIIMKLGMHCVSLLYRGLLTWKVVSSALQRPIADQHDRAGFLLLVLKVMYRRDVRRNCFANWTG